jgi:pimeloyl-ACP methyl ester carboxylesterase
MKSINSKEMRISLCGALVALAGCTGEMAVRDIGSMNVGGPMLHYVKLTSPRMPYPMLMMHGGGRGAVTWETKPDGNPGWQMYFLRAGYDVYVADAAIFGSDSVFRTGKEAWELFRIGPPDSYKTDPKQRVAHKGTQFPIESFDQFAKHGVPRWVTNEATTQTAYNALIQKICPCVIVVHSEGGNFAFNAALAAPDKVKAIVAVEPSGAPNPGRVDVGKLKDTPHLFLWGDYLDQPALRKKVFPAVELYRAGLVAAGVTADLVELPKRGIRGNSHMMMMDRNSDEIAEGIQRWLAHYVR